MGVEGGELGVVVEHFFEVGDEPLFVGGVAGEGAGDVVVDAAVFHGSEGEGGFVGEDAVVADGEAGADSGIGEDGEPELEGLVGGNLGAEPRPPWRSSKRSANCSRARGRRLSIFNF